MSNRTRDESRTGRRRTNCIPRITRSARNYARETGRRTMSHNSAGRLPYDSIVPRASLLDDAPSAPNRMAARPLLGSSPWPVFTRVGAARKELVLLVQTTLHYRTGYHGLHACVGRVEGSLFPPLPRAESVRAWSCRGHACGCRAHLIPLTCYTLAFFLRRYLSSRSGEGRCGEVVEEG